VILSNKGSSLSIGDKVIARDTFRVVLSSIITREGKILIGRKEESEGHPISGQWIFPGGHLDYGENVEDAVKREIKEETGLQVKVYRLLDLYKKEYDSDRTPMVRLFYHCEAEKGNASAQDDLSEIKWVGAEELLDSLDASESQVVKERPKIQKFIRKLEKMTA